MADVKAGSPHEIISKKIREFYNEVRTLDVKKDAALLRDLTDKFYQPFITPEMKVDKIIIIPYQDNILGNSLDEASLRNLSALLGIRNSQTRDTEVLKRIMNLIGNLDPQYPLAPLGNRELASDDHTLIILLSINRKDDIVRGRSILRGQLNGFSFFVNAFSLAYYQTKDDQLNGWSHIEPSGESGLYTNGLKEGEWTIFRGYAPIRKKYYIAGVEFNKEVYDAYVNNIISQAREHTTIADDPLTLIKGYTF